VHEGACGELCGTAGAVLLTSAFSWVCTALLCTGSVLCVGSQLSNNDLDDDNATVIARALRVNSKLKKLDLAHNSGITNTGVEVLEAMLLTSPHCGLESLDFDDERLQTTLQLRHEFFKVGDQTRFSQRQLVAVLCSLGWYHSRTH